MIAIRNDPSSFPSELFESVFKLLPSKELCICASVCKVWQSIADQEKLWARFIPETQHISGLKSKQIFIDRNKSQFFSIFPKDLIGALGGSEKVKELPYLSVNEPRVLANGMIQLSELNSSLTVGRISTIPMSKENKPFDSSDVSRYTFLAIRFINRAFDPRNTEKDVNIWITKKGREWIFVSGRRSWPTTFPAKDGGYDFSKTIEYISRLVKGEPCGIRDFCSPIEHSRLTLLGTSTIVLA